MAECDQARSDCAAVEGRAGVKLSAAARHTVENAGLRQRRAELEAEVASAREEADRIQSEWDLTKQRLANAEQRCVFVYGWWWFGWCPFTGELLPRGGRRVAELKSENSELQHQSVELTRKATSLSHQLDRVTNPALPHECVLVCGVGLAPAAHACAIARYDACQRELVRTQHELVAVRDANRHMERQFRAEHRHHGTKRGPGSVASHSTTASDGGGGGELVPGTQVDLLRHQLELAESRVMEANGTLASVGLQPGRPNTASAADSSPLRPRAQTSTCCSKLDSVPWKPMWRSCAPTTRG